jgi:sulfite exporter TauE/SafE
MTAEISTLTLAAASIAFLHTLLGPDHYLPFVVMSRAWGWSRARLTAIVLLCGAGHLAGSLGLGLLGVAFGLGLGQLQAFEGARASLAARALIAVGLLYLLWGLRRAWRNKPHAHAHAHASGQVHRHEHAHDAPHRHAHPDASARSLTPWVLFTLFLFGPCEPLVPLLMYPAATHSLWGLALVIGAFALVTLATMLSAVWLGAAGLCRLPLGHLERYAHALAGLTILLCGSAMEFLGQIL